MEKSELRKLYLAKQRGISKEDRAAKSGRIADLFFSEFALDRVNYLHAFIPIEKFNEVDTMPIFQRLWRERAQIVTLAPKVDFETNEIKNLELSPATELAKNVWEIQEPAHDEFVETERIDMVLVPGLCFDRQGHRVGYGKGFYDRFLKRCRQDCVKIGLSYFEPVDTIADVHEGDVRLKTVVTPFGMRNAERGTRNEE